MGWIGLEPVFYDLMIRFVGEKQEFWDMPDVHGNLAVSLPDVRAKGFSGNTRCHQGNVIVGDNP